MEHQSKNNAPSLTWFKKQFALSFLSSADKELIILEDSYHMVLYDNEKEFVFNKVGEFLNTHSKIKECALC